MIAPYFVQPTTASASEAISEIAAELDVFDDWMGRYEFIIDLGRTLPPLPLELRDKEHRIAGCQSQVWLNAVNDERRWYFAGASDAAIVSGLVALLMRVYSGRSAREIEATPPSFLHELGLIKALSTNRGNGVEAMARAIIACVSS